MDYTTQELRPLIYKDKDNIDCFNIDDDKALDAEMLRRIENSEIIKIDGASKYILEIFNNAHYIITLIMMEKHPVHFLSKYILIAKHTGSAYFDIYKTNNFHDLFTAVIMAMVSNYIRLLDSQYLSACNSFINQLNAHFNNISPFAGGLQLAAYNLYNDILMDKNLKDYYVDRNSFTPRTIDYQAVSEMESILYNRKMSTWRSFTDDYNENKIVELLKFCQNESSASFLAAHIRREADGYNQTETVSFIDRLDWKRLSTLPPQKAAIENKYAWLEYQYNKLLNDKEDSTSSENPECVDETNERVKQLMDELNAHKEKVVGLSREKAALFVLSIANAFDFNFSNKKDDLAPIINQLFGWGLSSSKKRLCEGFKKSDSDELAQLFDSLSPKLSRTIRNKGEKLSNDKVTPKVIPEVTPNETKVTSSPG